MWTILKFDQSNLANLKKDLSVNLGKNYKIYIPKIAVKTYIKKKFIIKEINLLGDYLFCYHESLKYEKSIISLRFLRGVKYFLSGYIHSQEDIKIFITRCKNLENKDGYLTQSFFDLNKHQKYRFISGPFINLIFEILKKQKNKIDILMGNIKTSVKTSVKEREFFIYSCLKIMKKFVKTVFYKVRSIG